MISRNSSQSAAGYTIFELVFVMTIVAILAGIAIPSFKYVTTSNRIAMEINGLLADMRYARSEAMKEGLPVTVCASSNGTGCNGGTTGDWAIGWIVFSDPNNNQTPPSVASILRVQTPLSTAYNSSDTLVADYTTFNAETFNRQGYGSNNSTTPANKMTLKLHSAPVTQAWTRCLEISVIGALTIEQASTGACT